MRVVIIQSYNTPYRNELFNQLNNLANIDLYLAYIGKRSLDRKWTDELIANFKEIHIKCKIKHLGYEVNTIKLSYLDFIYRMYLVNPEVVISTLGKYTVLLKYAFFWKKLRLINWSEATLVTNKGEKGYQKKYQLLHYNYPSAYIFPGKLAYDFHKLCGLKITNDNVFFAPNSVDDCFSCTISEIENKFQEYDRIKVLYVGSFTKNKSFDNLMQAFDSIGKNNSHVELHVAGDGPIVPYANAINHGFISKKETVTLYKSSHIFIMPSLSDCNPLSVIEAARCGCILLLSNGVGNFPELIDGNGIVFKRGNISDIINAIEFVLNQTNSELKKMSLRSIELSKKNNHYYSAKVFHDAIKYVMNK